MQTHTNVVRSYEAHISMGVTSQRIVAYRVLKLLVDLLNHLLCLLQLCRDRLLLLCTAKATKAAKHICKLCE